MKKESAPLSLVEVKNLLDELKVENKELDSFLKKFIKVKSADEIKKELNELGFIKIKPEHIAKIIDIIPEEASELNKIFTDVSLDENESNKILEIIKKFK